MLRLQAEIEATTLLVTHDPAEALLLADELLLLDDGHVLQSGPVAAVFRRPANEAVARLLGAENIAAGRAVAPDLIDVGGGIRLAVAGPPLQRGELGWAVRPDSLAGLTAAIKAAFTADSPTLIEVHEDSDFLA